MDIPTVGNISSSPELTTIEIAAYEQQAYQETAMYKQSVMRDKAYTRHQQLVAEVTPMRMMQMR